MKFDERKPDQPRSQRPPLTFGKDNMRKLILFITAVISFATLQGADAGTDKTTFFVFAKIQDTVQPIERGSKYEDPLDAALKKANLGEVTGGGSMLTKEKQIDWVGIDIELVNLSAALDFTKKKLRELGAPKGSVLEFQKEGKQCTVSIHDP